LGSGGGAAAPYRHAKLSAIRLAGELKHGPADTATLDELLERLKASLAKLGPNIDLESCGSRRGRERSAA
jgi:hypothetical protein